MEKPVLEGWVGCWGARLRPGRGEVLLCSQHCRVPGPTVGALQPQDIAAWGQRLTILPLFQTPGAGLRPIHWGPESSPGRPPMSEPGLSPWATRALVPDSFLAAHTNSVPLKLAWPSALSVTSPSGCHGGAV